MYYASTYTRTPKKKSPCTLITTDGQVYEGSFFCSGDQRIKDLLNGDTQFVPFEMDDGAIQLFNRNCIARVLPRAVAEFRAQRGAGERATVSEIGSASVSNLR